MHVKKGDKHVLVVMCYSSVTHSNTRHMTCYKVDTSSVTHWTPDA